MAIQEDTVAVFREHPITGVIRIAPGGPAAFFGIYRFDPGAASGGQASPRLPPILPVLLAGIAFTVVVLGLTFVITAVLGD